MTMFTRPAAFCRLCLVFGTTQYLVSTAQDSPYWRINEGQGECTITSQGRCLSDLQYTNNQYCVISALQTISVSSQQFATETCCDNMTIGNDVYKGTTGPMNVTMAAGENVTWQSDGSFTDTGWVLCVQLASSTVAPSTTSPASSSSAGMPSTSAQTHPGNPSSITAVTTTAQAVTTTIAPFWQIRSGIGECAISSDVECVYSLVSSGASNCELIALQNLTMSNHGYRISECCGNLSVAGETYEDVGPENVHMLTGTPITWVTTSHFAGGWLLCAVPWNPEFSTTTRTITTTTSSTTMLTTVNNASITTLSGNTTPPAVTTYASISTEHTSPAAQNASTLPETNAPTLPTPLPSQTAFPTTSSFWNIAVGKGECRFGPTGHCVTDLEYRNNQRCTLTAKQPIVISNQGFVTETCCDIMTINGVQYSGATGPKNVFLATGDNVTWASDGSITSSGWVLCASAAPVSSFPATPTMPRTIHPGTRTPLSTSQSRLSVRPATVSTVSVPHAVPHATVPGNVTQNSTTTATSTHGAPLRAGGGKQKTPGWVIAMCVLGPIGAILGIIACRSFWKSKVKKYRKLRIEAIYEAMPDVDHDAASVTLVTPSAQATSNEIDPWLSVQSSQARRSYSGDISANDDVIYR
eukprot:m.48041 g.48041  ORF g.48041 m.48041 type:complete len:639 (-) comp15249_c0_seq4:156-2072(-)